jgi:hypothetical protein
LVSSIFATSTFAAGTGDNNIRTKDIPTAAQKTAYDQKMGAARASIGRIPTMAVGDLKTVGVTPFKQEKSFWCGPATTKQILNYMNGSSSTQTYYAGKLGTQDPAGTDFSLVDNVLNAHQSTITYIYSSFSSTEYEAWKYARMYSVDQYHPAALDLKIDPSYMPIYTRVIEGHILNNSGYDWRSTTTKQLRLTDPFDQDGRGVTHRNIWHPMDGVWKETE